MQVGYYPGCSLESSAKEFDLSIRAVLQEVEISLKEIPDWNCCGASPAHYLNEELAKPALSEPGEKAEEREKVQAKAAEAVEERLLELLLPGPAPGQEGEGGAATREKFRDMLRSGKLEDSLLFAVAWSG